MSYDEKAILRDMNGNPIPQMWDPIADDFAPYTPGVLMEHAFHDAATEAADGAALTIGGGKTLTVEIYGTSTSRTISFKGAGLAGAYRSIMGVNLGTLAVATSTIGTGEFWQFDVSGLVSVIMDLDAVAGGNVTVKGRLVA